ncbi:MAG: hypothetical protein CM15mV19_1340 [uncultured marine virus]|nr:MAG: hypothetical protein CM15mV19_1340 [uncultured marine virus]
MMGEKFLSTATNSKQFEDAVRKVSNEQGTIESTIPLDFEPKSDKELAELHKIDLDRYVITNYWSKGSSQWEVQSSVFSRRKGPERLYS